MTKNKNENGIKSKKKKKKDNQLGTSDRRATR